MNIVGNKVVLRAIEGDDIDAIHRWTNDPEVQESLGGWHFPVSKAGLLNWIASFRYDGLDQRFIIDASKTGPVGLVTLTSINWKDRNAFHGVLIGERQHRRKGLGADAVLAIMRYAFEELNLQRLDTTIVEYNTASLALHVEACGWVEEGRKAMAIFRKNRFWANVILGITRDRYLANFGSDKVHRSRRRAG